MIVLDTTPSNEPSPKCGQQRFRIAQMTANALAEAGGHDVDFRLLEHRLREVKRQHPGPAIGHRQGNRDPGRAGADVEHFAAAAGPVQVEEVPDEPVIDHRVIHRVILTDFLGGLHRFGLENAWICERAPFMTIVEPGQSPWPLRPGIP